MRNLATQDTSEEHDNEGKEKEEEDGKRKIQTHAQLDQN